MITTDFSVPIEVLQKLPKLCTVLGKDNIMDNEAVSKVQTKMCAVLAHMANHSIPLIVAGRFVGELPRDKAFKLEDSGVVEIVDNKAYRR